MRAPYFVRGVNVAHGNLLFYPIVLPLQLKIVSARTV